MATHGIATSFDGIPIHFDVHGTGAPALVLVHGALCRRTQWNKQIGHFAPRYTLVTVDLAGHGESGTGRKTWNMASFGEDVAAVVRELDLEQAVLVGHSMGGLVILEAANRIPECVIGLVGVDCHQALDQTRTPEQVEQFIAPLRADFVNTAHNMARDRFVPGSDPSVVRRVLDDISSMRPDVGIQEVIELFSDDQGRRAALRKLAAPIIVIARDTAPYDLEAARRYRIEVVFVSGTGHWIMMEKPETFNRHLEEAIAKLVALKAGRPTPMKGRS